MSSSLLLKLTKRRRKPRLQTFKTSKKNSSKILACFQLRIASSYSRREIAVSGERKDHGQCLTEETLTDYLEGGLDPAIRAASEVHLIGCDACRSKLGFYMRLLNEEISAEETAAIESLTADWEKKSKERIAHRKGVWR